MRRIALIICNLEFNSMNSVRKINGRIYCDFSVDISGVNSIAVNIGLRRGRADTCRITLFGIFSNRDSKINNILRNRCIVNQCRRIRHTGRRIRNIPKDGGLAIWNYRRIIDCNIIYIKSKFSVVGFCIVVFPSAVFNIPFDHGSVVSLTAVTIFARSIC